MTTGTIIVHEPRIMIARQLARCLNPEPGGEETFSLAPLRQTPDGRRWSVASGQFSEAFLAALGAPLVEPPEGCDMAAAREAQSLLRPLALGSDGTLPPLDPDHISYVLGLEGVVVMAMLGLDWPEVGA
jgi:hypothetical protein